MQWSLRVITGLTADTEPSIILKFESPPAKYVFNVPEGFNRACIQKRYAISKTKAAFLTRLHPEELGGFPGLVMMLADMKSRDLTVCGPPGLTHYVGSTRFYTRRTDFGVTLKEYKQQQYHATAGNATSPPALPPPIFQDENIIVHSVPFYPSSVDDDGGSTTSSGKRKRSSSASPPPSPKRRSIEALPVAGDEVFSEAGIAPLADASDDPDSLHRERIVQLMFRPPTSNASVPTDTAELSENASTPALPSSSASSQELWSQRLPKYRGTPQTLAYFVVGPSARGKFDAKRAKELGVLGPMCSKLTKGETVTTPSGNVVTPDMCIGPSVPPPAFLFVHLPDPSYIDSLLSQHKAGHFLPSNYGSTVQLHAIVHRVGPGVLEDKRYREWMTSFDSAVNHMVASERYSPNSIAYPSSARMQLELTYLDKDVFRLPHHDETPAASLTSLPDLPPKTSILTQDTELGMYPRSDPLAAKFVPADDFKETLDAINSGIYVHPLDDLYKQARADAQKSTPAKRSSSPARGRDVAITTLGTGSAMPSKYRNVSSTLIQIPNYGSVLLDAGEGTWGQLARQFGAPVVSEDEEVTGGVVDVLQDIKCIFVSHVHGDHHMGLAKILARRRKLNPVPNEPLSLIANRLTLQYLSEFNDVVDFGLHDRRHVDIILANELHYTKSPQGIAMLKATLGLKSIQTVDVEHRVQCFGLVIKHKDGWSAAYSGDTMPCDRLVEAGQGATVLIHEATMADDQADLAFAKAHSTAGQAIDVGRRMNAKNILLTHFSQRYPKMPELQAPTVMDGSLKTSSSEGPRAPVAIAFDCARLRLGSLWKMEKYMAAMARTFVMEPADETLDGALDETEPSADIRSPSPTKNKKNKQDKRLAAMTA